MIIPLWEMIKDPLMKGLTQAKNDLTESINEINDAISLLSSSRSDVQLQGLEKLHTELSDLLDSEAWKLMTKSRVKQFGYINSQLNVLLGLIDTAIEEFDKEGHREKHLTIIEKKANRVMLRLPKTGKKNYYSKLLVRVLLLAIPVAAVYWLTDYIGKHNKLKYDDSELISPVKMHEYKSLDNSYLIEESAVAEYYEQLQGVYFNTSTKTAKDKSFLQPEDLYLKVVSRNSSGHVPLMLSSLSMEVTYNEAAFDWSKLNTEVELDAGLDDKVLVLRNLKSAPAVDVKVSSSLGMDTVMGIIYKEQELSLFNEQMAWPVNQAGDLLNGKVLYYRVNTDSVPFKPGYISNGWGQFKILRNVADLMEVQEGKVHSEVTVEVDYLDVKGQSYHVKKEFLLDQLLFVHKRDTSLLAAPYPLKRAIQPAIEADFFVAKADKALSILGHQPILDPDGTQLYKDSLFMNLRNIQDGASKTQFKNIDQVLNPDGYVILYLRLKEPGNGQYSIDLFCNGKQIDVLNIQTLVAPERSFRYPESLQYFRTTEAQEALGTE